MNSNDQINAGAGRACDFEKSAGTLFYQSDGWTAAFIGFNPAEQQYGDSSENFSIQTICCYRHRSWLPEPFRSPSRWRVSITLNGHWVIDAIGVVLGGVITVLIHRITDNVCSRRLLFWAYLATDDNIVYRFQYWPLSVSAVTARSVSLLCSINVGGWRIIQDVVHKNTKVRASAGSAMALANMSTLSD